MNAITTIQDNDAISVLGNSLYPGAKPESVAMVLAYCRAAGYDPMKKPVHIVPMSVKLPNGKSEMRDIVMPGIAQYRIDASRTGEYAGKSEPEFGPDQIMEIGGGEDDYGNKMQPFKLNYPLWCRVTIFRIIGGEARPFTATERWLENYATSGRGSTVPNAMWRKRPYAQLAKCAEAQALRMAFPEQSGGTNTNDEMEGKTLILEHEPAAAQAPTARVVAAPTQTKSVPTSPAEWLVHIEKEIAATATEDDVHALAERTDVREALSKAPSDVKGKLNTWIRAALERVATPAAAEPDPADAHYT